MSDGRTPAPEETADFAAYDAIINGKRPFDPEHVAAGRADWEAGKGFHEGPKPFFTVAALSWRHGWNERALEER